MAEQFGVCWQELARCAWGAGHTRRSCSLLHAAAAPAAPSHLLHQRHPGGLVTAALIAAAHHHNRAALHAAAGVAPRLILILCLQVLNNQRL